jgi:hypothetical protein
MSIEELKRAQVETVGFTGTRKGMTNEQRVSVALLIIKLHPSTIHHGCCIGADEQFDKLCKSYIGNVSIIRVGHPSDIIKYTMDISDIEHLMPIKPPLERNKNIVLLSNVLIACPDGFEEKIRSGTWSTVRYAKKQNKKIHIVFPDGKTEQFN